MAKKKWRLECSQHMKKLFSSDIDVNKMTEDQITKLIKMLMCKYALSEREIINMCYKKSTKNFQNVLHIQRHQSRLKEKLYITYSCHSSNIDVVVTLTDI